MLTHGSEHNDQLNEEHNMTQLKHRNTLYSREQLLQVMMFVSRHISLSFYQLGLGDRNKNKGWTHADIEEDRHGHLVLNPNKFYKCSQTRIKD